MLNWRNVTPSNSTKFLVKGTELNVALCGPLSRFQICEVRAYDAERNADREYVVRDAHTVSDADVRAGKRPAIVARFTDEYDAINYCVSAK